MPTLYRLAVVSGWSLAWGATFFGALSLSKLNIGYIHSLCGPWGCLPETAPLVSVHAMWLTLTVGLTWIARIALPILSPSNVWLAASVATMLALGIVVGVDVFQYYQAGGERGDLLKRGLYYVATNTDVPLVQLLLANLFNFLVAARSCPRKCSSGPVSASAISHSSAVGGK